jgi:hypothetical protein
MSEGGEANMRDDVHQLVLIPLADRAWRLRDQAVDDRGDPSRLVAYVELHDDGMYEAVWVSGGCGTARFTSLEMLFLAAVQMLEQCRSLGALKPDPIPHRPPARA